VIRQANSLVEQLVVGVVTQFIKWW